MKNNKKYDETKDCIRPFARQTVTPKIPYVALKLVRSIKKET